MAVANADVAQVFQTDIPGRMDRLPWSRWHWLVITALGITWIIDGLEVTMVASIGAVLQEPAKPALFEHGDRPPRHLIPRGGRFGALVFGYLTDRLGRKKLFTVTLGLYLVSRS